MRSAVETLVLPGFGWVFQWRDDGYWRHLDPEQFRDEQAGTIVPADDDWIRETGTAWCEARGDVRSDKPRWFFLHGELPPGSSAHVRLRDGTEPVVLTVGGIWVCEWFSRVQDATVTVGEETFAMLFERIHELSNLYFDGSGVVP
jgi:hypothetical protein